MKIIDHIAILENLMPSDICKEFIDCFESTISSEKFNFGEFKNIEIEPDSIASSGDMQFNLGITGRNDLSLFLNLLETNLVNVCYDHLQVAYENYSKLYPDLNTCKLISSEIKMQKTPPGGGYHVWHSERMHGSQQFNSRHVAWMIYLNDMPEGEAETEFFHQKLRIQPTAGTVVLWPAAYTHLHRGNTVYTQDKYILTGWFRSVYEN
jgi:hypothetical protein